MASIKISELNEATELESNDLFAVVDTVADETKKMSYGSLKTQMIGDTIAIVSGSHTYTAGQTQKTIGVNYPTGFTKNNCVVIGVMIQKTGNDYWVTGSRMSSNGSASGAIINDVFLRESGIEITLRNTYLRTSDPYVQELDVPGLSFKIILMKTN